MSKDRVLAIFMPGKKLCASSCNKEQTMTLRVLLAIASPVFRQTMRRITDLAVDLLPWPVEIDEAADSRQLEEKLSVSPTTLLLLDWEWGREEVIALLPHLFERNPFMRVVVLLPPAAPKAYRTALWRAGACASTPRDRLDEEWLVTILCLVRRAMEREGLLSPLSEQGSGIRLPG